MLELSAGVEETSLELAMLSGEGEEIISDGDEIGSLELGGASEDGDEIISEGEDSIEGGSVGTSEKIVNFLQVLT